MGVTEETISRWKQGKDFKIYMAELLIDAHEVARTRLQNLVGKAFANIEDTLNDQNLPAKDKFAISVKIMEMCGSYNFWLNDSVKKLRSPLIDFDF